MKPGAGKEARMTPVTMKAEYIDQDIIEFKNNPFIESLPPLSDFRKLGAQLTVRPPYSNAERFLPDEVRLMLTQRIVQFHQPSDIDIDLASRLARCIRWGYINRNPFSARYAAHLADGYVEAGVRAGINYTDRCHANTYGFAIIGVSGIGKTITVERILSLYPHVVEHTEYNGIPLITKQVVWLKIDCPCDGTLKGLCSEFFRELDRLLGTDYLTLYNRRRTTLDRMLSAIAQLVYVHNVGLLIFDELQNLGAASKGTSETALNFFVTLVNTSGVPVVMMGTPKILSILQKEFQQAKRGSGQGDLLWPRMNPGETWDLFVESMWDYQYTKENVNLSRSFIDALYDEAQGIPFLAVHIYKLVQEDAILSGRETFQKKDIARISDEKLGLTKPMREAIKRGKELDVRRFVDISDFKAADYVRSCGVSRPDKDIHPSKPVPVPKTTVLDEAVVTLMRLGLSHSSARCYAASVSAEKNGHAEVFQIAQEAFLKYTADSSSTAGACSKVENPIVKSQGYDDLASSGFIAEEAV